MKQDFTAVPPLRLSMPEALSVYPLLLGSASPRRRELLSGMGARFEVLSADADEHCKPSLSPCEMVKTLSLRKARAVRALLPRDRRDDTVIIASDTLVEHRGVPLGKPEDEKDAYRMLSSMRSEAHEVHTGICLMLGSISVSGTDTTRVRMRDFSDAELSDYIKSGEPMGKAGAYAIQGLGGSLVEEIDGALDTVIGLSRELLLSLLKRLEGRVQSARKRLAGKVTDALKALYPDAECALTYGGDPYKLLVMGRLSAQCTDKRVNEVSHALFARFPTAESMAEASADQIEPYIRSCGLYHSKARDLSLCARRLTSVYGGTVPREMDDLLSLAGVGRKIANLLRGDLFGLPAVVTDTHFIRICGRLGFYPESLTDPYKIERLMIPALDPAESADFCHRIVWFGRDTCTARSPKCVGCPMKDLCKHSAK